MGIFEIDGKIYTTGAVRDKEDKRDYMIEDVLGAPLMEYELPLEFTVSPVLTVKYQDGIPSCVAQATTGAKEPDEQIGLSARFLFSKCKKLDGDKGWGTSFRQAQKAMQQFGVCKERLYPEKQISTNDYIDLKYITDDLTTDALIHRNESYYSCGKKRQDTYFDDLVQVLFQFKKRIVCGCDWYESYNRLTPPFILPAPTGAFLGGHAWYINGWKVINGKRCLVMVNSYSSSWGDNGCAYLSLKWFNDNAYFGWINLDLPKILPIDERYGQSRTWTTFLKEKVMVAYWTPKLGRLPSKREVDGAVYGYWDKDAIFNNRVGDAWLYVQKPAYLMWELDGTLHEKIKELKIN